MHSSELSSVVFFKQVSRCSHLTATVAALLVSMLVLGGLSFSRSSAYAPQSKPSAKPSPTNLRGQEAIDHLKQQGLYSSLQEAMLASRYKAEWQAKTALAGFEGAYELKNEAHNLRCYVAASEVRVVSLGGDPQPSWQLGMKLTGYGYGDSLSPVASGEITAKENRVEINHPFPPSPLRPLAPSPFISEWYVNTERGIEQGFTINSPPQSAIRDPQSAIKVEPLRLTLELTGSLEARLDDAKQAITLSDCRAALVYSGLEAFDALGQRLAAHMELEARRVTLVVDDTGAEYPVNIDPLLTQLVKLTASDGADNDQFGQSVAISGDTVVVGAFNDDVGFTDQGSAYVFVRSGTTWTQQQRLTASDGAGDDRFGNSVAISGDTVVVGAFNDDVGANTDQGSAYVFVRSGTAWTQQQKLTASDGGPSDNFGNSVAISGDTVVVGAIFDDVGANANQGSAYIFVRSGTTWTQQQKLTASDGAAGDLFGQSVAISGDTVVVGAFLDSAGANLTQGSAYVFVRSGTTWAQQQKLTASDGAGGDHFGNSVAISGDTVVVGANLDNVGANSVQGSAYVFVRSGTIWTQQQKLTASDGAANDLFGESVGISGDTVVVSARFDAVGANTFQGSAYVFVGSGTAWTQQQKLTASDGAADDRFGQSVAISGDIVVVGAVLGDVGASTDQGSAYIFSCGRTNYAQLIVSDGAASDLFGHSVAISGDTVVVGALFDDVLANIDQGSAYVFIRNGTTWVKQQQLIASDGAANDVFGVSVAVSGDTVVVGALADDVGPNLDQGSAYVFVRSGNTWTQQQKLTASDGAANDFFGRSVAVSGDTVVVGSDLDDVVANTNQGSAYVFVRNGSTWSQQQQLLASDGAPNDQFGNSVSISGDTVVVGAFLDDVVAPPFTITDQGSAYIFVRSGTTWSQQANLTSSDGLSGDNFGNSVAISGDTVVVGADLAGLGDQGAVYVFVRSGTTWSQQQRLFTNDTTSSDDLGVSVSISGDTIVVGAYLDDVGANTDQGSAYVFVRLGTSWQQQQQPTASDGVAFERFGNSVAISGDTVVAGAPLHDVGVNGDQGSAYVFFSACNTAPAIAAASGLARQQGSPASLATLATVSDFQDSAGSLAVTATSVPSGISLTSLANNNGSITAILAATCTATLGATTIALRVTDSNGATSTTNVTVNVTANTTPTLGVYPATSVSTGSSATVNPNAAPVDNGSVSFAISIPGYLGNYTFNPVTGVLSVSNSSPQGIYPVTITATDNCGFITSTAFPLTVGAVITVNPATLPSGFVGVGYNQTLTATGGTSPYTFAVTSGTLPPGLTLSSGGALSGTPGNGGNFSFTARATDNSAALDTGSRAYSLVISGPTTINLISLDATGYDDGVLISWQTGYEVNNLGFNLHRDEGGKLALVNSQLIAGSALVVGQGVELGSGYSYKWWDKKISDCQLPIADCQSVRYWLEDIDLNGHSTWHGPFLAVASSDKQHPALVEQAKLLASLGGAERVSTTVEARAILTRAASSGKLILPPITSGNAIKIAIKQTGWYKVTQPELISAGLDPAVDPHRLQLFADGRELAISVTGEGDGRFDAADTVAFYATGIDSPYSNSRIYRLIAGQKPGKRISALSSPATPFTAGSFALTIERKDRSIYFAALRNGERENFFGSVVYAQALNQTLTVHHLDSAAAGYAALEVALQGVTSYPHQVLVQLNGAAIGYVTYQGQENKVTRFLIPFSLLEDGQNTVTLRTTGYPADVSLVDFVRLTYQHSYTADGDSLMLTAEGQQQVTIGGFTSKSIRVFDVTGPEAVQELTGEIVEQGKAYALAVRVAGSGERTLLALTDESAKRASKLVADVPSNLRSAASGADLLIVTHRDFIEQAGLLADLRRKDGLSAMIVDVEDIYDEFSYGQKTPQAVKDFLLFAKNNWKAPPRYLVLFGDACYDTKNYLGLGEFDLVPTKLVDTVFMESASDDWFADFDGDGIAEIAVGRLPARAKAEADLMMKKLIGYGQSGPSQETLLAADANDGYDFEAAIDRLRALVPPTLRVVEVKRGQMGDTAAKAALLQALNRGQSLATYSGHGSANSWRGNLLINADASALTNRDNLTVFVMMNCLNGYFNDPQTESLAEALLKAQQGGAIAVWASSAMTFPEGQEKMSQELYRRLFGKTKPRLGDAVRMAKSATQEMDARRTWVLLGDPAMRLK